VLDLNSETVNIVQSHQMIRLEVTRRGISYFLGEGRILGDEVALELQRPDQQPSLGLKGRLTPDGKTIRFAMQQNNPTQTTHNIAFERL
jgi:hypothetical protein